MQLGTIESIWRYPVKGMRGEEIPYTYTAFTGLMGDRVYGVVAADGSPGHPWHTGRNQEEFILYSPSYKSDQDLLLPQNLMPHIVNGHPASILSIQIQMHSR